MRVRLTQIDGKLPNLALMKLAHWHRSRGDEVHFTADIRRDITEPHYDRVYGSAIFTFSASKVERFRWQWPGAVVGGTGIPGSTVTVEDIIGQPWEGYDYSIYPGFDASIGFTQRGCRQRCSFCVVPEKEGAARAESDVAAIWRGEPHPRKLLLLDNDFFGQPAAAWRERVAEIRDGRFRVCLSQGVNLRRIDAEQSRALASLECRDGHFERRRVYTAWDNVREEQAFFRGVGLLEDAGLPARFLMAYMLVGHAAGEDWPAIFYRFGRLVDRSIRPYAMVYDRRRLDLLAFARWVNLGLYRRIAWPDYVDGRKSAAAEPAPSSAAAE